MAIINLLRSAWKSYLRALGHDVDGTYKNEYVDETEQMIEIAEKLRIKQNNNQVDIEFTDKLLKSLREQPLKMIQIGECDPYRYQTNDTFYTDTLGLGDITIYIVYKKNQESRLRTVTDITFTLKGNRYYPSKEVFMVFIDRYDEIKDYDRSFLG